MLGVVSMQAPTVELNKDLPPPKYKLLGVTSTKVEVKEAVIEYFGKSFAEIVACESGFKVKQPQPLNKNGTRDNGIFQINDIHRERAKKIGIDIDTIEGQFKYTEILIKKNGYRDWNSSKHCWENKIKGV